MEEEAFLTGNFCSRWHPRSSVPAHESRMHKREKQTEVCIWRTEGERFYTKLQDCYKITKSL